MWLGINLGTGFHGDSLPHTELEVHSEQVISLSLIWWLACAAPNNIGEPLLALMAAIGVPQSPVQALPRLYLAPTPEITCH